MTIHIRLELFHNCLHFPLINPFLFRNPRQNPQGYSSFLLLILQIRKFTHQFYNIHFLEYRRLTPILSPIKSLWHLSTIPQIRKAPIAPRLPSLLPNQNFQSPSTHPLITQKARPLMRLLKKLGQRLIHFKRLY